jgi:hypothetical protein
MVEESCAITAAALDRAAVAKRLQEGVKVRITGRRGRSWTVAETLAGTVVAAGDCCADTIAEDAAGGLGINGRLISWSTTQPSRSTRTLCISPGCGGRCLRTTDHLLAMKA